MDFAREIAGLSAEQAELLEALLREAAGEGQAAPEPGAAPQAVLIQKGARHPLFIIHGSGGQVLFLHGLARHMSALQPVYGIEAGRGDGFGTDAYLAALRAVQPHGPYWLGGYSAGCLRAFDMAARLRDAGEEVTFLLLIDPVAVPGQGEAVEVPPAPREKLRRRFEMAELAGVTPLSPEFAMIERVNRDFHDLARNFRPAPVAGRIHVIHGTRGAYVASSGVLAGWAALAGGGLVTAAIEADHFEIVRGAQAAMTARQIQAWLDRLQDAGW